MSKLTDIGFVVDVPSYTEHIINTRFKVLSHAIW